MCIRFTGDGHLDKYFYTEGSKRVQVSSEAFEVVEERVKGKNQKPKERRALS